jgi:hypothetical protein
LFGVVGGAGAGAGFVGALPRAAPGGGAARGGFVVVGGVGYVIDWVGGVGFALGRGE